MRPRLFFRRVFDLVRLGIVVLVGTNAATSVRDARVRMHTRLRLRRRIAQWLLEQLRVRRYRPLPVQRGLSRLVVLVVFRAARYVRDARVRVHARLRLRHRIDGRVHEQLYVRRHRPLPVHLELLETCAERR